MTEQFKEFMWGTTLLAVWMAYALILFGGLILSASAIMSRLGKKREDQP